MVSMALWHIVIFVVMSIVVVTVSSLGELTYFNGFVINELKILVLLNSNVLDFRVTILGKTNVLNGIKTLIT